MPWPVHPTGFFGARGDSDAYRIERSLRFNSADSAYLSRTPSSATNQKTYTFNFWVKRSQIGIGTDVEMFSALYASTSLRYAYIAFEADDTLNFFSGIYSVGASTTTSYQYRTTQVFRDPSAWYMITASVDTTNATASERVKLYVNGIRVTSFSTATQPSLNQDGYWNSVQFHGIGTFNGSTGMFPGYLAEINFIDGQVLAPSSFGETDPYTGRWKAKAYSGTYGTNGYYLKFSDNSGTTSTTLGKDSSGNGNNWTPNNFSVTAGAGNDSLVDSPTNYGADTGVGGNVRGNYATLNPLSITSGSFVQGNLRYTGPSGWRRANGTIAVSSGKWYWEVTLGNAPFGTGVNDSYNAFGWGLSTVFNSSDSTNTQTNAIALADNQHYKNFSGSATSLGTSFASGDVLGCAVDLGANTFTFYRNGSQLVTGTIGGTAGRELVPIIISYGGTYGVMDCNFGQRPFAYTAPTGFKALCTQNLPQPTIQKPSKYMDALAYTGTGASNSISSLGFSPDLVWIKNRGTTTSHAIYDTTRGAQSQLSSDTTGDQVTSSSGLTSFDANGFTIGTSTLVNTSGTQYVAWGWDESVQAGLDIVSYTGNGANRTISHNLGVAPKMIIVKARTTAGADQGWPVWHTSIANTTYLTLNSTASTALGTDYWNSTSPTSSVFSLGTNAAVNANNDTYIAYAFSEVDGFSKFGTYTGNGSADGPFVYCGFLPKFILFKYIGAIGWIIYDTARDTSNVAARYLFANSTAAEAAGSGSTDVHDILSNGFKVRTSTIGQNTNGGIYTFAAFAESPFKYARAR